MSNSNIIENPNNEEHEKLVQSQFNINVAFYVHLKAYNNSVREELEKRLSEVFFFTRGIDWKFDSFGIEKTGSRGTEVLGYFIFRAVELDKLQKLFVEEFKDYENAINENTAMLMKVHKSNYSIEGFASDVDFEDIVKTAQQNSVIDYYDMGSGHMIDLPFNLSQKEPSILEIMKYKPSLLSFSGDKLLGSVQAGIIIGKKELISKIKKNQLLRMLRVDKITLSILEDNLNSYLKNDLDDIPTLKMLFTSLETLENRANSLKEKIDTICTAQVLETQTLIGGGTTPNRKIPSFGVTISYKDFKPNKIEKLFRQNNLICRIENEKVLLDFRTIQENEITQIASIIAKVFN